MTETDSDGSSTARFFRKAIGELCNFTDLSHTKVLDFGCGKGDLVRGLLSFGVDAFGCDIGAHWLDNQPTDAPRFAVIPMNPYRLPFADNTFDVVVSTSVLEHAQNKEEVFEEIHRVLRVGGYAIHLFPPKWRLPYEPHIYVPLVNVFWPICPRWWLALWVLLGVRNEFQQAKPWREVVQLNHQYCKEGLSYWSNRRYQQLSLKVFGNYSAPMDFYVNNAEGGLAKVLRKFPFKKFLSRMAGELRTAFIVQRKTYK